jgi:predicted house-cleaning noncanonical NTP pyrophosphatase (MazG superfamily)
MNAPKIIWPDRSVRPSDAAADYGRKAMGLIRIPLAWCPPFFIVPSSCFLSWQQASVAEKTRQLDALSDLILEATAKFASEWNAGIILRSSAVKETLNDRGAYESRALPADYSSQSIRSAMEDIFNDFHSTGTDGSIAVIVQPIVPGPNRFLGHLSNERRVSKTVNHWMYEIQGTGNSGRFNSQRAEAADSTHSLIVARPTDLLPAFRSVGRWSTQQGQGPAHIEWALSNQRLWILQLDLEDESPDVGVNPRSLIRPTDSTTIYTRKVAPLRELDANNYSATGWKKLDNVRTLADIRTASYPKLYYINGSEMDALSTESLLASIQEISNGRAVCRTDCNSSRIADLNLPRTHSVSPEGALQFMNDTLAKLVARGAARDEVCFILHRFIPAMASAWALADPKSPIVRIDSLWGIPDGLQFLPHDTFEYDVRRQTLSSEILRYKNAFIQETENGSWKELQISRRFGRASSLSDPDVREIATQTFEVASELGLRTQIMWFCDIPVSLGIGTNLPWFKMKASPVETDRRRSVAPSRPRFVIRTPIDLAQASTLPAGRYVLTIHPDIELIRRDDSFLTELIEVARLINGAVELHGSILGHAYYVLSKAGLTVIAAGEPSHTRARGKQIFAKLVRDQIPDQIQKRGENTVLAHIPKNDSRAALVVKLFEEAHELLAAKSPDDVEAELGDLVEVIRALAAATGVSWNDVINKAEQKRQKRGGFEAGTVLMETSWPSDAPKTSADRIVPLKSLASRTYESDEARINYPAFFAPGADRTVRLDNGVSYQLTLTGSGLSIKRVASSETDGQQQLLLPFQAGTESQ